MNDIPGKQVGSIGGLKTPGTETVRRWLIIYLSRSSKIKAALIDDVEEDGKVTMPYGIEPHQVADDCSQIQAIILSADPPTLPFVVIGDKEFKLGQPNEDVPS